MYVLNAGPSIWSAFHVIGTVFDRTVVEGLDLTVPPAPPSATLEGTTLGAFTAGREIGRGGMSIVYSGERADGQFDVVSK